MARTRHHTGMLNAYGSSKRSQSDNWFIESGLGTL